MYTMHRGKGRSMDTAGRGEMDGWHGLRTNGRDAKKGLFSK